MNRKPRSNNGGNKRYRKTAESGNEKARLSTALTRTDVIAGRGPGTTLEFQPRPVPLRRGLAALRHRDFRLFWSSQIISLTGTWMQVVAQSWLVLELTNSPLALGLVTTLQFLPILFLSVFGGVLADRLPRRQVLLGTQTLAMLLALVLAILTQFGVVDITHVMILAVLLGVVSSVDMPTRQAFVVELIDTEDLGNAIALSSAAFNSARLIGPAVAGLVIGWLGLAACFYLNAGSFLAVIIGLLIIKRGSRSPAGPLDLGSVWSDLGEGLRYVVETPQVRLVVLLIAIVGSFGMNFSVLVPVLARDELRVGAAGYGLLTSALGLGSLAAALLLAYVGQSPRSRLLLGSAAALGVAEMVLAGVNMFPLALLLVAAIGFAMIFLTTLTNTVLQTATPDYLRGRVMSLYTTVLVGSTPVGSLIAGAMAQSWGVDVPFFLGGLISLGTAIVAFRFAPRYGHKG